MYKQTIRRFWPALVAALALTCCIEDKLDTSDPATEWCAGEADYVLCLNLQSVGETAGRAESNASSEEVTIGRTGNYILLFDEGKRLISVEPLVLSQGDGYFDEAHPKDPSKPQDPDLEKTPGIEHYEDVYMATKIRVREQQQVPAWCLVLVNAQEVYNSYLSKLQKGTAKMEDVLAYPLNTINDPYRIGYTPIGDETPGTAEPSRFLMTNSSYVDETGDVVTAVPIDKEKHLIRIENAISDAEIDEEIKTQLTEKKKFPVVAHVEPLVAKFSLEFKSSYPDDVAGGYVYYPQATTNTRNAGDQITKNLDLFVGFDENGIPQTKEVLWRVVVTGWNINAQETQTKIFKNIPEQESRPKWNWTDFGNFRSYWAEDPHYGKESSYPWQYRTAIDYIPGEGQDPMPTNYAEGETKDSNLLKNYSFNDLNVQYLSPSRAVYVPENTYDYFKGYDAAGFKRAYDNRGHVLAGTHVIVCAKLQISMDDGSSWRTFSGYRDRAGRYYYYNEADEGKDGKAMCFIRMMRTFNYYLNSQSEMRYVYYEWEENPFGDEAREGNIYYARPSSGGHVNDDDDDDDDDNDEPKHQYEVYLDGIRMFDEDETRNPGMSGYGFWNRAEFKEYPHQYLSRGGEEYMLPAEVKDGDGKAIPWLRAKNGESRLKILDVNNPDEVTTGNRIPVYEYNQESIDYAVNLFASSRTFGQKENGEDYTKKEIEVKRAILREDFRDWLLGAETTSQFDRDVIIKCRDSLVKEANIPPYVQAILCGEPLKQRSIADNDRRSLFYDWLSALDHFKDGKMYYAAKVANANVNTDTDEDSVPYGTVRNSWYQYTLTGIRHVGTPVDQLDDPIVPQSVLTFDQIHVKVHILGWHTVEMNVTLPD